MLGPSSDLRALFAADSARMRLFSPFTFKVTLGTSQLQAFPWRLFQAPLQVSAHVQNQDFPVPPPKNKKKPFVRPPKRGGFLSKKSHGLKIRKLRAPENGLLVAQLVPVAHMVHTCRARLIKLLKKLMEVVPVKVCKYCGDTHIGCEGNLIATCDGLDSGSRRSRLKTVQHEERLNVERIPAILELCIQAGVDLPHYPTLRRTRPVKMIGRTVVEQYEPLFELGDDEDAAEEKVLIKDCMLLEKGPEIPLNITSGDINDVASLSSEDLAVLAQETLNTWESMRNGAKHIMKRYPVRVCGYCPEVHVGPRGNKVKLCGAFKHQWRAGQHGWQEATVDDLIPPKYVWHVTDPEGAPLLVNELRKYYGKAPAVVELCVQAGAMIPDPFKPLMRLDVVTPDMEEKTLVV